MKTIYGHFKNCQIEDYKKILHNRLFWLLLYKDPETKDEYPNVDFERYFTFMMRELNGLNQLLNYPTNMVRLMSLLEAAHIETQKSEFDYRIYRKLVLDAHNLADSFWEVEKND